MNRKLTSANYRNYIKVLGIIALMFGVTAYLVASIRVQAAVSTHCHVTDGAFTRCTDGSTEWSDITPVSFNVGQSYLYADEAKFNPSLTGTVDTLFLMYDDVVRTSPLTANEYVEVSLKTVENIGGGVQHLQHYSIHIYGDGTFSFFENGVLHTTPDGATRYTELEDMRTAVGFGTSPNSAIPHVTAEFQIGLTAAGAHSYSPDPLFWSSTPPALPDLKCYAINDVIRPQMVNLADQFGVEANVNVTTAVDLCVTTVKSLPGVIGRTPNLQLDLKCYAITDQAPSAPPVDIADQFGPENKITVGQPDRLCGWVLINPSATQVPQFKVDYKCYLIQDTASPAIGKTVSLTGRFGNETSVTIGAPDHLCAPVTKTTSSGQTFPPPPPFDQLHYKCYSISGQPATNIPPVTLLDEFGIEQGINVKAPDHLCLTASKTGPPPTQFNPPDLKCYGIQGSAPRANVNLEVPQFNDVETNVTVGTPRILCVTAMKSFPGHPAAAPRFSMDWKCYDIKGTNTSAVVTLQDQFGFEPNVNVGPAFSLCTTVQKTTQPFSGGPPSTTVPPVTLDFKCYSLTRTPAPINPTTGLPFVVNLTTVFPPETNVQVGPAFALCASAVKTPPGTPPPVNLDYKCYAIRAAQGVFAPVNLTDQFHTELNVLVTYPQALCEPAVKKVLPQPNPIPIQPPPDFKCHTITDIVPRVAPQPVQDQFGFENLTIQQPFMLCGLTTKTPPGIVPSGNLDLKCYATTDNPQNITVNLSDQFENEFGVRVGRPFALCVTAIKNGIQNTVRIDGFKCYSIFGNQPPNVVTLTDQFGSEPNVRVGPGFALCTSISLNPTVAPIPWDLKCYAINGTSINQKVSLADRFSTEPSVPVSNPVALCTTVTKIPHITSPVPTPLTNCFFAANAIDTNKTGTGDPCRTGHTTAAILQAHDVGVTVTPESTSTDPSLLTQLRMIIDFRCVNNATCRQKLAMDLVNGEVSNGVISQSDSAGYISSLGTVSSPTIPYVIPVAIAAAVILATIALYKRKRLSAMTSSFFASILASSRISRRRKHS